MTGLDLFEFFWGFVWGSVLTVTVLWVKRRPHKWKCPECEFRVAGNDRGLVDFVILEHSEAHEAD